MPKNKISAEGAKTLTNLVEKLKDTVGILDQENTAFVVRSNKQASKRARVASIEITNLAKEYRKESMKFVTEIPIKV